MCGSLALALATWSASTLMFVCWQMEYYSRAPRGYMRFVNNCHGGPSIHYMQQIPGHALHEKGSQRQKSIGPLVSSQERRAAVVSLINRLSTARQPLVVFLDSVYIGCYLSVLPKKRPGRSSPVPWGSKWTIVLWAHRPASPRPVPPCPDPPRLAPPRPAPPRPSAPPCPAPSRPAGGISGFWIRQVVNHVVAYKPILKRQS